MNTTAIPPDGGQPVEFAGVPVKLGRCWYVLPALNVKALRQHRQLILEIQTKSMGEQLEGTAALVFEALRRNYPDVTFDTVESLIDLSNFQHLLEVTMGISGMELVDRTKAEAGNVQGPVATGPSSTPILPAASAGPGETSTSSPSPTSQP